MKLSAFVLGISFAGLCLPSAASAGPLGEADEAIGEAFDAARDSRRGCHRRVMSELHDLRYDVQSLRSSGNSRTLRAVLRAARGLRAEAEGICPASLVGALGRVTRALAETLHRWERHAPEDGGFAPRAQRHHRFRHRTIECWSASDPGCGRTRNGHPPMDRAAFTSFLQLVRSARPHIFPMRERVQSGIQTQYLTSLQLGTLLEAFRPHVFPMLEVVKICAPRLVDPQNGAGVIASRFAPHTMVGSDAAAVVAAQAAD